MHPIEKICDEYEISRYSLAKKSGLSEQSLSNAVARETKIENLKLGSVIKIADALDLTVDKLITKLMKFEEENIMENRTFKNKDDNSIWTGLEIWNYFIQEDETYQVDRIGDEEEGEWVKPSDLDELVELVNRDCNTYDFIECE